MHVTGKRKKWYLELIDKTINQHLQVFDRYSKAMVYIEMFIETSYLHKNVGNTNVSNCQIILNFQCYCTEIK